MNCAELTFIASATEQDVEEEEEEEAEEEEEEKILPEKREKLCNVQKRKKNQQVFSVFTACHGAAFVKFY